MKRNVIAPRDRWQDTVASQGLTYHTDRDGHPYWYESAYYEFSAAEIDVLYDATVDLYDRCMEAVAHVVERDRLGEIGLPVEAHDAIRWSWENQERSLYGRFDLAYNGDDPPKMLEFNADTPTSLVEGAVIQWYWLQDRFPEADQFNTVWEELVACWKCMVTDKALLGHTLYFTAGANPEDWMTITMLRETAEEAGIRTKSIDIDKIGWDTSQRVFVDLQNNTIQSLFKLYPWEWLLNDRFGPEAIESVRIMQWIEPVWKLVLSCKGILPVLWELFPDHPNLLPCYAGGPRDLTRYVSKPVISREGQNVAVNTPDGSTESPGRYGGYPRVYQSLFDLPIFDGGHPVIGSWVVGGKSCGIGVRESQGLITDNSSLYVPHLFRPLA